MFALGQEQKNADIVKNLNRIINKNTKEIADVFYGWSLSSQTDPLWATNVLCRSHQETASKLQKVFIILHIYFQIEIWEPQTNTISSQIDKSGPHTSRDYFQSKTQQTKMLVTCQRFGDLFLFGLVWQYSSIQKNIIKVGSKSWILTCSCHITLSLPLFYVL